MNVCIGICGSVRPNSCNQFFSSGFFFFSFKKMTGLEGNDSKATTAVVNNEEIKKQRTTRPILHFMAGGVGGTVGAIITCPLEVVKTRLQSSEYRDRPSRSIRSISMWVFGSDF
jgi:hypothetical protein